MKHQLLDKHGVQRRRILGGAGAALAGLLVPGTFSAAHAQAAVYPTKPVRIMLGYSPGGTSDVMARLIAENLQRGLNQPFIVENRPGASGSIAAQAVASADPDGYTLLFGNTGEIAINHLVMPGLRFNPQEDFEPIVRVYNVPLALVVPANSPFDTLEALVNAAKETKGKYFFASAGAGSPGHLAAESLALESGASLTHVPYKGAGPALTDLIGGHVDCYFAGLTAVVPHLKAGSLKVIAVSSKARSEMMPDVPTVAEFGLKDFDFTLWGGLFGRAGTDPKIIKALSDSANEAFRRPEVMERMRSEYSEAPPNSPEEFRQFIQQQTNKYGQIAKAVGLGG